MSNRDALRRLSQKIPATPEIERIMDGLGDKDDIHIAITAVSILEATLERLIITRLTKSNKELLGKLFQNRGPISDFNSKILIAEALGILTGPLAEELHSMRAIRNVFAHAKTHISFKDEPVAREVASLKILSQVRTAMAKAAKGQEQRLPTENKEWFLLATRLSLIVLDEFAKKKGSADELLRDALELGD
jgi:DNA-binding MltR family transcriptional regulator